MYNWIEGNIPRYKEMFYWITIKGGYTNVTYPVPCKYFEKDDCWISFTCEKISKHTVVAYFPIYMPKSYSTIGSGVGYYISTKYHNTERIYGFGLQPANWVERGYGTKEKAIAAAKRLMKMDRNENYVRENYEVVDSNSEVVWVAITSK